jgi:hypothetical protein
LANRIERRAYIGRCATQARAERRSQEGKSQGSTNLPG